MLSLRPYQVEGVVFLASRRHALLADEMRVGKTPQAIIAAEQVNAKRIAVVCPAIGVAHWPLEFQKWASPSYDYDLDTISFDRFVRRPTELLDGTRYDVAIVDECHWARNPTAARTKLIYGKNGLGWSTDRLWLLSGTPVVKHAGELWPFLRVIGAVKISYSAFCHYYCWWKIKDGLPVGIGGTKRERIPELTQLLKPHVLRRTRGEARGVDTDDILFNMFPLGETSPVDLPAEAEQWLERSDLAKPNERIAVALSKIPPLVTEIVGNIDRANYTRTVVFGWHHEVITKLAAVLEKRKLRVGMITGQSSAADRAMTIAKFKAGALQVIVCNILAAGTTIDLSAARHGYFIELDWLPANNAQAASRLVNVALEDQVTIDVAIWPGSIDDKIQRVLTRRSSEIAQLL